ncbi:hypothetical protein NIES4071_16050 [Calothrix sp. NIES-4071]|nr:hypothetical protein NIES4071_16050 [Calothrix sp. NIES-4071]BAZ55942.1 hypothetical protein NIES4105_16000 [Calothrix sp. NIES-4105]
MVACYNFKGAGFRLRVKEPGTPYIVNNQGQSNEVEIVSASELSYDEQRERERLERQVERAFYEAGRALRELRDQRLYRSSHKTFEEYCHDRFGYSRRQSYYLIDASAVVDNLLEKCEQIVHILPTNENQVRSLTSLEPEVQCKVWEQAVKEASPKVPSGKAVKSIVDRIRERTRIPVPYLSGEVCTIITKENPDLKGKGGHWCIVKNVYKFSCQVLMWDGDYVVKPENLKSLNLLEDDSAAMQELCKRLRRLNSIEKVDDIERSILQAMGKRTKPLTAVQQKVLALIEKEYGIE